MSLYKNQIHFVLGSSSPRRKDLLKQIGIVPDSTISPKIDETLLKKELPLEYLKRVTNNKMIFVKEKYPESLILTADTIVSVGRRILQKTYKKNEAKYYLSLLSGRRHRVITAFVIYAPFFKQKLKYVTSIVKFKRLSVQEINYYLDSDEWKGKAGGYAIQGLATRYINFISGSYSNVVGLPLSDVYRMLVSTGYNLNNEEKK